MSLLKPLAALLLLAGLAAGPARADAPPDAPPDVVVTVKPLHALVAGVMQGVGEPALLVPGSASPHAFSLRPSDARALNGADLVVWAGPRLETFMERPLRALAGNATVLELMQAPGMELLDSRGGGVWQTDHGDHGDHSHGDGAGGKDGHIWLDPHNAQAITRAVAAALIRLDPARADIYRTNEAAQLARLAALDREIGERLAPVKDRPFIVFHDAYQYLEHRYGLNPAGTLTVTPDQKPGAARLSALRRQITEAGAACVFAEPQFEPTLVRTLAEGTPARTGVLDPEGASLPPGPGLYEALMRFNADALAGCLGR
ncbi:zinc ABC transporter substrate-binding protein [Oleisolibacter albus]|uniref:zinc ABC transporter substrate-binding protein n=1 Tax=Oleisolibacter albus TaxID=2171757 RepID=UPI000DF3C1D2|nr:zinc ABC transporter substrate-binding protein [Oleisolibacter albus]